MYNVLTKKKYSSESTKNIIQRFLIIMIILSSNTHSTGVKEVEAENGDINNIILRTSELETTIEAIMGMVEWAWMKIQDNNPWQAESGLDEMFYLIDEARQMILSIKGSLIELGEQNLIQMVDDIMDFLEEAEASVEDADIELLSNENIDWMGSIQPDGSDLIGSMSNDDIWQIQTELDQASYYVESISDSINSLKTSLNESASTRSIEIFDFTSVLLDEPTSLHISIEEIDTTTGSVKINGVDLDGPTISFSWNWGDNITSTGWLPLSHVYQDITKNYIVKVTSHYSDGSNASAEIMVHFSDYSISRISLPQNVSVIIPIEPVTLQSRLYSIPETMMPFDDSFFINYDRSTIEYILSVASMIQIDFVNNNVYLYNDSFNHYIFRDPTFGGGYSTWYTNPPSFALGDYAFQGTISWASLFHEMGHGYTLNSPAYYYYGGKTDGNANAIFSESTAQIFQHATAIQIINFGDDYGLGEDIIYDIKSSAISGVELVKSSYEEYIDNGMQFCSWNDPSTPNDETFETFMVIAYKFLEHAENSEYGYESSVKRMMILLQTFNEDYRERYDQGTDSSSADTFRSTLMVSALSYAFNEDLRDEFRDLNFPISDEIYIELISRTPEKGLQPEPEPEPKPEPEPEPEPELEKKGIPGFPYLAITLGLMIALIIRDRVHY